MCVNMRGVFATEPFPGDCSRRRVLGPTRNARGFATLLLHFYCASTTLLLRYCNANQRWTLQFPAGPSLSLLCGGLSLSFEAIFGLLISAVCSRTIRSARAIWTGQLIPIHLLFICIMRTTIFCF